MRERMTRFKRRKRKQKEKKFFFFLVACLRVFFEKNQVTSVSGAQILKSLGLALPQYTAHVKNTESKYDTTWKPGNRRGCHDRQMLS